MEHALKLLAAALCGLFLNIVAVQADDLPLPFGAKLKRIIDGDSISVVASDGHVSELRLWGIDAPEFGAPWSRRSTQGLKRLLQGRALTIVPVTFDRYDRLVCEIFVGDVNAAMALVENGLAWVYRRYNNRVDYIEAQERAQSAGEGLWSDPAASSLPPWEWRRVNKTRNVDSSSCGVSSAAVVGNRRSMIFHYQGCPDFAKVACGNRVEFASTVDARADGYRAARNCKSPR